MITSLKAIGIAALAVSSVALAGQAAAQSYSYRSYSRPAYSDWRGNEDRDTTARPARELFEREARLDRWIRNSAAQEQLGGWQARQLSAQLSGIRRWTARRAQDNRGLLLEDDFARISQRLDQLTAQIRAEQEEDNG